MLPQARIEFDYRPALDGLRCLAVCSVIVYHLDSRWLPGGFLGVDVFFTLSGYLITSLLLIERDRTGRIDRSRFWARRAKRLLPASLVLVAVVSVWLLGQPDVVQAARRGDLLSALGNVMNWRLIASGQSYFQAFASVSPVRHFWSLAIEEQFYLVWPVVCAALLRSGKVRSLAITCTVGAVASASLCAMLFSSADPSRAYYGTDTRVHQILIGAILAIWFAHRRSTSTCVAAGRLAAPSLIALGLAVALVGDQWSGYYRGGSVVVAALAATVILAIEADRSGMTARIMGFAPFAAIGRVSYGLYLWHWPIIVWITPGTWGIRNELLLAIVRVSVTGVVTAASYLYIEQPIRRGRRLPAGRRPRFVALASLSAIAGVAVLVETATWGATMPVWAGPQSDRLIGDGSGVHLAMIGDSVVTSLVPGLATIATDRGWSLLNASEPGCPITGLPQTLDDGSDHPNNTVCAQQVPDIYAQILHFRPDIVLWHDLQSTLPLSIAHKEVPAGSEEWGRLILDAWQGKLDQLRSLGAQVVIVLPPLRSQAKPNDCGLRCEEIQHQDERIRTLTTDFLLQNSGDEGVHELDLDPALCPTGMPCPSHLDGVEVRLEDWDQTHFTPAGAAWIAPRIFLALDAALDR